MRVMVFLFEFLLVGWGYAVWFWMPDALLMPQSTGLSNPGWGAYISPLVIHTDGWDNRFGYKKGQGEPGLQGS